MQYLSPEKVPTAREPIVIRRGKYDELARRSAFIHWRAAVRDATPEQIKAFAISTDVTLSTLREWSEEKSVGWECSRYVVEQIKNYQQWLENTYR